MGEGFAKGLSHILLWVFPRTHGDGAGTVGGGRVSRRVTEQP